MKRTHAVLLALGLALAGVATAVTAASLASHRTSVEAQPGARHEAGCSTCDGFRLMLQGNYPRAMSIFQLRAAEGDAKAMYDIGWMYHHGLGRPPNLPEAVLWYGKSADLGDGTAQFMLGELYDNGIGVPVNRNLARSYHEQSFVNGYPQGLTWKGMVYLHGDGVAVDYGRAMALFRTAFASSDARAMNEIGFMYQHGLGRKPNPPVAWCWYNLAVASGYDGANKHLQELEAAGVTTIPQNCDVVVRPDYRDQ